MTLEDYAHVRIIVLFVVPWQHGNIKTIYSFLFNWLPWKHTPCVLIKLFLKSSTMYVVLEYKLLKKIHLYLTKLEIIEYFKKQKKQNLGSH